MSTANLPIRTEHLPTTMMLVDTSVAATIDAFFNAEILNAHTRAAYVRGASDFFRFVAQRHSVPSLDAITPMHIAGWLDDMTARRLAVTTQKQRLAGLRMLFNALVRAQILRVSPVAVVKGPRHSIHKGKTPVLAGDEAQQLLASIDTSTLVGLRDRAMIATMTYTFARIGAVTSLEIRHVFRQQRRLWLRLSEKGGKSNDVPCHHQLEADLGAWIDAAGIAAMPNVPLFQSFDWEPPTDPSGHPSEGPYARSPRDGNAAEARIETVQRPSKTRRILSGRRMTQAMTWEMLQRRAKAAGITTHICNHTFRATGITAYLKNGGTIERAAIIAGHASTRTTQLYDRRSDTVTLDEIEKIRLS